MVLPQDIDMEFKKKVVLFFALFFMEEFTNAQAGDSQLLRKIKDTGVIKIGHRESSIPFSYYDNQQKVVGYSQDLLDEVIKQIGSTLSQKNLKVIAIPINSQNRIPLILNGSIDIECGSTTHNFERERQVAFSTTFFVANTKTMVRSTSNFSELADLKGKNVAVTAGTSAERILRRYNNENALQMRIISAKDHSESFLLLAADRVAGLVMDDALLYGERAKTPNSSDWKIIGPSLSKEAYACMLRKGDKDFKTLVDNALVSSLFNQAGRKLYEKWFLSPIPPKAINLNWPPSGDVLNLYDHPNDQAFD